MKDGFGVADTAALVPARVDAHEVGGVTSLVPRLTRDGLADKCREALLVVDSGT